MTLNVGLVHTVKTIVVEHCIHFCLTGIVACTHSVHIALLHQKHVAKHSLHINGTSCHGMCILQVSTLEEYTLAIDIYLSALYLDVAETIFRREDVLLFSVCILLRNNNSVKVRSLCCPGKK